MVKTIGRRKPEQWFQDRVIQRARHCGFEQIYHTWDSRHSPAGFPDLILLKGKVMIVAELKDTGKQCSAEQYEWLLAFLKVTKHVYLWYPEDEENEIAELFERLRD